jgi:hypothetical protein
MATNNDRSQPNFIPRNANFYDNDPMNSGVNRARPNQDPSPNRNFDYQEPGREPQIGHGRAYTGPHRDYRRDPSDFGYHENQVQPEHPTALNTEAHPMNRPSHPRTPRHDIYQSYDHPFRVGNWQQDRYSNPTLHYGNSDSFQDRSEQTSHRGKGPKNFKRSDERILEDVCEMLEDDERIDASQIEVHVARGIVSLMGPVESRFMKKFIENEVDRCRGVSDVKNELEISDLNQPKSGSKNTSKKASPRTKH